MRLTSAELLESHSGKAHSPRRKVTPDDDLLIDDHGLPVAPSEGAKQHLAASAGAWKLLSTPSELLLALRDRGDGILTDLSELHPSGAVLTGDMSEMQPFLHQGRRTGLLLTRSDGTERGIVLIDGNVAWACSTSPGERLGELLIRSGLADRTRIETALADQAAAGEKKRIGQMLVERGVLGQDAVLRGMRHQVVEIFLGLLVARSGSFVFMRNLDQEKLPSQLGLDTQAMLLDGLRRLDEMELYRTLVPASESVPRSTHKTVVDGEVTPEALKLLSLADGARTVASLAALTALGEFEATKAVYKLIKAGYLEL